MMAAATVLLIDDDDRVRDVIKIHIVRGGYVVREARDGASGLAALEAQTVDAVLCDIRMRGMTGVDVLEKARGLHPTVPIIMLTGFVEAEQAAEVMKLGAFDYLTKPVQRKDLLGSIAKAVEWRRLVVANARLEAESRERQRDLERRVEERARDALLAALRNALEAMPEDGRLTVRLRRAASGQGVAIEVEGDGGGISPEAVSRILEPFGAIAPPSGAEPGADSRPGRTTFEIALPAPEAGGPAGHAHPKPATNCCAS